MDFRVTDQCGQTDTGRVQVIVTNNVSIDKDFRVTDRCGQTDTDRVQFIVSNNVSIDKDFRGTDRCGQTDTDRAQVIASNNVSIQGRIQDFKLKKCWGISCEKSQIYANKYYFFPIVEGGA